MFNLNEAVKHDFKDLSKEDQDYILKTFLRYIVRSEVADNNKILSSMFSNGRPDARVIAGHFQSINSAFVNCNLISQISYDEATTTLLRDKSNESFNYRLAHTSDLREGAAVILFSQRPNENIPNRIDDEVLVAYSDMQTRIIRNIRLGKFRSTFDSIVDAAKQTRYEYNKKYGKRIEDHHVLSECQVFSRPGKKTAIIWTKMLEYYKKQMQNLDPIEAIKAIQSTFVPTIAMKKQLDTQLDYVEEKTREEVKAQQRFVENKFKVKNDQGIIIFDDYADIADYDEAYSPQYELQLYKENLEKVITQPFDQYKEHLAQYTVSKTSSNLVDVMSKQRQK